MSNNLVSQPMMIPTKQMEPIPNKLEVPISDVRVEMVGEMSNSPKVQQFDPSRKQSGSVQPMPNNFGYYNAFMSNRHLGQEEKTMSELCLPQHVMLNQLEVSGMKHMFNNQGSSNVSLLSKRTAAGEPKLSNSVGLQLMTPNKNISPPNLFINNIGMQHQPAKPALNKKMVRNESISGRSGTKQVQTPKSKTMQMEPSPKNRAESFETVRSKMRESLASALALVTEQQGDAPKEAAVHTSGDATESSETKESIAALGAFDGQSTFNSSFSNSSQGGKGNEAEFHYATALSGEEGPFADTLFVQDELLQGNGLTWAMDLEVDAAETKEEQIAKKPKLVNEDVSEEGKEAAQSPESLASKIEAELFKLFGGVNKKYKEKGRSLLFNLKDRSNPELRERVMSGDISPQRLCAMSAEELASKELSEWRMAKAKELAQMVVLPDTDVDIRRLVRKTHKGEFQVEVEQDDGISVEVSVGTNALSRPKPKNKNAEAHRSPKVDESNPKENLKGEKSTSENQDLSCNLTIPNDVVDTDFMQGLMADEFKDADFLPPIVSLDEFMQSLDSEPPFEVLHVEGEETVSPSEEESSKSGDPVRTSDVAPKEPLNATTEKPDKMDKKHADSDGKVKSRESPVEEKLSPIRLAFERVWEGVLQLNVSAGVNAIGFFTSGEKTLTKEWPPLLEIKGRVRLDAFEKFIQDLPMSRSRAVMVVQFVLKEGSTDADHATLGEAVHSYVLDERLGIAEPIPGVVEIYFCPPHPKILEMLGKHLKSHTEILNTVEKGLIGVVVWRRAHISSTISPNLSSHHKHVSKKIHHLPSTTMTTMTRTHENNVISNVNFAPQQRVPPPPSHRLNDEDDDDIPPGFGPAPGGSRDEDDLPEFNFSGRPIKKSNVPNSRPVDQMRELVLKYGQTGNSNNNNNNCSNNYDGRLGIKPWNDEDEDDIPEWMPSRRTPMTQHIAQQQLPQRQQQQQPWAPLQQPQANTGQGGRWVNDQLPGPKGQGHSPSVNNIGRQQLYGGQRFPRGRGF